MKYTLLLLLAAQSAHAHACGPDGGAHHMLPLLPGIIFVLKICWDCITNRS